ncbi:MAG: PorV/PorQ family protein, partial [Rhodothermales bacterium]|nr:PorV/PorQ family protein [Rhodothermales bacterium]
MKTSREMANNWRANTTVLLAMLLLSTSVPISALGQDAINESREKRAQTGFKFLAVSVHPRAAALGNAMTAVEGDAWTLFYNPAGMAAQTAQISTTFGITQWIAGIDYNAAAISFRPFRGRLGVFGLSVRAVDYGSIQGTIRADNDQGFLDTGTLEPTALSVGLGYARALTDRFSIGGRVKFATQDLGSTALSGTISDGVFTADEFSDDKLDVFAFDFGMLYKTGFRSLTFAVAATNFSEEIEFVDESFQLPLTLRIGVSMN